MKKFNRFVSVLLLILILLPTFAGFAVNEEEIAVTDEEVNYDLSNIIADRDNPNNDNWNLLGFNSRWYHNYDYGYTTIINPYYNGDGTFSVCLVKLSYKMKTKLNHGVEVLVEDKTQPIYTISAVLDLDPELNVTKQTNITQELDQFDAFTRYGDRLYVLFSADLRDELEESASHKSDTAMRICEYNLNGKKLRSIDIPANPADAERGIVRIDNCNPVLYADNKYITGIVSKQAFVDEAGGEHYNSYVFAIDKAKWTRIEKAGAYYIPYASHGTEASIVRDDGNYLYTIKGDFYPRSFLLTKMSGTGWDKMYDGHSFNFKAVTDPDAFLKYAANASSTGLRDNLYYEPGNDYYTHSPFIQNPPVNIDADTHSRLADTIITPEKYMLIGTYEKDLNSIECSANVFVQLYNKDTGLGGVVKYLTHYNDRGRHDDALQTVTNCKAVRIAYNTIAICYMLSSGTPQPGSGITTDFDSFEIIFVDNNGNIKGQKSLSVSELQCLPHMGRIFYNQVNDAIEWFTFENKKLVRCSVKDVAAYAAKDATELVTSITPSASVVKLDPGNSVKIDLNYSPSTAVNSFKWSSDNEQVAVVSADGTITCRGYGRAVITVEALSGVKTTITVEPATTIPVEKIEVKTLPQKTIYFVGESLDTTGLSITVTYADSSTAVIDSGFTVSNVVMNKAGAYTVKVSYMRKQTSFTVTAVEPTVTSVKVLNAPDKVNYFINEEPDLSGIQVEVKYNNGTTQILTADIELSDYDFSTPGIKVVTINYGNYQSSFKAYIASPDAPDHTIKYYVNASVYCTRTYKAGHKIEDIGTPVIPDGYTFGGWTEAIPELMPENDLTFYAKLNPNQYNAVFTADGKTVETVSYYYGAKSVKEPEVPSKVGYTGKWPAYTLPVGGVTIKAVYTPITTSDITVKIKNNQGTKQIKYGESLALTATASKTVGGSTGVTYAWYVDGKEVSSARGSSTFTLSTTAGSTTVELRLINSATGQTMHDKAGNVISDSETVTVRSNFFLRIISAIKNLFRISRVVTQKITGVSFA